MKERLTNALKEINAVVLVIEEKERCGTYRVISNEFKDKLLFDRIEFVFNVIEQKDSNIIKECDLTFELLAPDEVEGYDNYTLQIK